MNTYQLYIGSNNATRKLEIEVINSFLAGNFDGYTINKTVGFWRGIKEASAVVTVATEKPIKRIVQTLKEILKQDAIMTVKIGEAQFI